MGVELGLYDGFDDGDDDGVVVGFDIMNGKW